MTDQDERKQEDPEVEPQPPASDETTPMPDPYGLGDVPPDADDDPDAEEPDR